MYGPIALIWWLQLKLFLLDNSGLGETPPPPPPHQHIEPPKTAPPMTDHEQPPRPAVPPHKDPLAHHSSIAGGVDIDRKRLVESISDHLYGRGNLWARDDDLSVAQPQCAGCRRTRSAKEKQLFLFENPSYQGLL